MNQRAFDSADPERGTETPLAGPRRAGSWRERRRRTDRTTDGNGGTATAAKTAVLVTGMHHSGTSAITRILGIVGCDLPQNLLGPHPSNERGFWESPDIVDLNRDILVSAGTELEEWRADEWRAFDPRWYSSPQVERFHDRAQAVLESQFGDSRLFVIKAPRICHLLPFWVETLARFDAYPLVVSPIRNPLDVAESLEARDSIQLPIGCLMWLQHVLNAEAASRELTRAFLRYEQLLADPHAVVDRLEDILGVTWPRRMSDADAEIDTFLSSGLRHHRNDDDRVLRNPRLSVWLRSSFEIFDRWARGDVQETDTAELNRIRTALDEAMPAFDRAVSVGLMTTRELRTAREELDRRKEQLGTLTGKLAERDGYIQKLTGDLTEQQAQVAERDGYIQKLTGDLTEQQAQIAERDGYIQKLTGDLTEQQAQIAERDGYIQKLTGDLTEQQAQVAERDGYIQKLTGDLTEQQAQVAERDGYIQKLTGDLTEQQAQVAERDGYIQKLVAAATSVLEQRDAQIAAREREIGVLTGARAEHDRHMTEVLADLHRRIEELNRTLAVLLGSRSWRLTRPLRAIMRILMGSRDAKRSPGRTGRGPISLVRKFRFHARTYGLRSAFRRTRFFIAARLPGARRRRARKAVADSD